MKSLLIFAISTVLLFGYSANSFSQSLKDKLNAKVNEVKGVKGNKVYINELDEETHTNFFDNLCVTNPAGVSQYTKDHNHEVLFSSEEMMISDQNGMTNMKGETDAAKTTFSVNDPIYFNIITAYGPQKAKVGELDENGNYYEGVYYDAKSKKWGKDDGTKLGIPSHNGDAEIKIKIYMDGEIILDEVCTKKFKKNRYFSKGFICFKVHHVDNNMESTCWKNLMASLSEGEHTLKVEVYPFDDNIANKNGYYSTKYPMASGECTIVRKAGEDFSISYGTTWKEHFVAANDTELEKTVLASAKRRKSNITDTKITRTWKTVRNELTGVILKRYCTAAFLYKTDAGDCEVVEYEFLQEYYGGKFQGEIKMNYSNEPYSAGMNKVTRMDCE